MQEVFGADYDDYTCPLPTPDYIHFATFQRSDDSPSFTDEFGNVLNSTQSECGLQGQISPLSIRELVNLNLYGYGVNNVGSVVDGKLGQ